MSGFDTSFSNILSDLFSDNQYGDEAVFTPLVGDQINLYVVLSHDYDYQPLSDVQVAYQSITISYKRSDIDRKVLAGEIFIINGTSYTVISMSDYPDSWCDYYGIAAVTEN